MQKLSVSEQLMYTTVRIECEYERGGYGTGTGFFFKFMENAESNTYIPVIITNRHVIEDNRFGKATTGRLIFCTANEDGSPNDKDHYAVIIQNFYSAWKVHPDKSADLCAMPLILALNVALRNHKKLFYIPFDQSLLPNQKFFEECSSLEEIIMIGYPNGLWDEINNKPIFRRGITATDLHYDYDGKKEFLIDCACFPGSSGSPVIIYNPTGYSDKNGNIYFGTPRIVFLGVMHAGPQATISGEIKVVDVPAASTQKPVAVSTIPNNLGYVIKAIRVLELEHQFE